MSAVKVCALADIASGQVRKFAVEGRNIAVVRIDDNVYAIGDKCSHADVSLSEGEVLCDTKELECFKHGSAFSLVNGMPNTLPATQAVPVYAATVVDGNVMITLEIRDLQVSVGDTQILNGITLTIKSGEVHAVMGPNGAGKSTLSAAIMGKPGYTITGGQVLLDGKDVLAMATWERAVAGLHLVMQYPTEVPGVKLDDVLSEALKARSGSLPDLTKTIATEAARIGFDTELVHRAVNVDFSGGEKKRNETLQLAVLQPRIAIIDELDSGLDIDALRDCAQRVEDATKESDLGVLVITHYSRMFEQLKPDFVHILAKGRIVKSGGPELADDLERDGYAAYSEVAN
jgi:Fe-S cluster assembly ATP-binding protein